jgi:hypothetical protein
MKLCFPKRVGSLTLEAKMKNIRILLKKYGTRQLIVYFVEML